MVCPKYHVKQEELLVFNETLMMTQWILPYDPHHNLNETHDSLPTQKTPFIMLNRNLSIAKFPQWFDRKKRNQSTLTPSEKPLTLSSLLCCEAVALLKILWGFLSQWSSIVWGFLLSMVASLDCLFVGICIY